MCRKILPTWGKWVEEATEGRVKMRSRRSRWPRRPSNGPSVENGIADVAAQFNGFIANRVMGPDGRHEPFHRHHGRTGHVAGAVGNYEKYFAEGI